MTKQHYVSNVCPELIKLTIYNLIDLLIQIIVVNFSHVRLTIYTGRDITRKVCANLSHTRFSIHSGRNISWNIIANHFSAQLNKHLPKRKDLNTYGWKNSTYHYPHWKKHHGLKSRKKTLHVVNFSVFFRKQKRKKPIKWSE